MIRTPVVGLVCSGCFLIADIAWLGFARPPGTEFLVAWFALLLIVGAFVPGWANQVTLARAHLAAPALVYSLPPLRLVHLAAVVGLGGLSDVLDGMVARQLVEVSRLGGALDPVVDGLLFGAVAVGLAFSGTYPVWLAAVVVARYALPALAGGLLLLAGRHPVLRHTPLGQASTFLIALLLGSLALARGIGLPAGALVTVSEVAIPVSAAATFANLLWANRKAILGPR